MTLVLSIPHSLCPSSSPSLHSSVPHHPLYPSSPPSFIPSLPHLLCLSSPPSLIPSVSHPFYPSPLIPSILHALCPSSPPSLVPCISHPLHPSFPPLLVCSLHPSSLPSLVPFILSSRLSLYPQQLMMWAEHLLLEVAFCLHVCLVPWWDVTPREGTQAAHHGDTARDVGQPPPVASPSLLM